MFSLQTVIRFRTSRWLRVMPSLRSSSDVPHVAVSSSLPDDTQCSSTDTTKVDSLQVGPAANTHSHEGQELSKSSHPQKHTSQLIEPSDDIFESQLTLTSRRVKTCQYFLTEWHRQVKQLQLDKLPVNLNSIVSGKLAKIVDLTLQPTAPTHWRHACLALLLSQEVDLELTCRIMDQTVVDFSHLPFKVIADIIQTLSTSPQTPLRMDTRRKLVAAVINHRYYEITAKHLLMLMYQLDELFDMRNICKQQLHRDRPEKPVVQGSKQNENIETEKRDSEFDQNDESANRLIAKTLGGSVHVSPIVNINIEHRATNVISDFKAKDLARVLLLLARWRNRNETLINAVVHRLSQTGLSDFNYVQLSNLLHSFSVLNVYNHQVLQEVVSNIRQAAPVSPGVACSILSSLSHLRWDEKALISECLIFLAAHISELTVQDAHSVLMSLANLYIVPTNEAEADFIIELMKRVFSEDVRPVNKLNYAWCLAVLLSLDAALGESLLQPEFVRLFTDAGDIQKLVHFHKLCSVNTALQYEVRGYSGPLLSEDQIKPVVQHSKGCSDKSLSSEFQKSLKMFVDLKTYVDLDQTLKNGVVADAVMCANSCGELRPLSAAQQQDEKVFKLAVQLVPFSGVLNLSLAPSGSYRMVARHWKHLGFVPVQILYSDLKQSQSSLEKISNIKAKIKSAVEHFVADEKV